MTKEDIKNVITSCRKRLGKPKIRKVDPKKIQQKEEQSCYDDPSCPTSTVKKGFG